MAKSCKDCGAALPLFSFAKLCSTCEAKEKAIRAEEKEALKQFQNQRQAIEDSIISSKAISSQQLEFLRKIDKKYSVDLYEKVYSGFEQDKELEEKELDTLNKIQEAKGLTNEDISYVDKVLPYIYAASIKDEGKLPTPEINLVGANPLILKKGETIHFASSAKLSEIRTTYLGYEGRSAGSSIRVMKGMTFRLGANRGHMVKEENYRPTSAGALIITNQRLYLDPSPGSKPVTIPLNKVASYGCYQNGFEVYKEGREKAYLFSMSSGAIEIFSMCLGFLLKQ
jgi:uncharacterized Zn finger protein (UPF0148 family)